MWYKAQSDTMPSTIDDTSSQVYVYARRNINPVTRDDETTGETKVVYEFEEAKIPREVFDIFRAQSANEQELAALRQRQDIADEALQELILSMEV